MNVRGSSTRRVGLGVLGVAVPFAWFALGSLGGPLDVVAIALPLLVPIAPIVLGVVAVRRRRVWPFALGVSIALVAALATAAPRLPIAGGHPVRPVAIAFANIFKGNEDWAGAREALLNRDVDVLGVIEVPDQRFSNRLNGFADDLPYHTEHGWGGIWSRWPLEEPYELEWNYANLARVVVRRPGDPFVLYLVHGENPLGPASFGDHRAMIERLLDSVEDEHLPVVLIGDLNASDRTSAYRDLEQRLRDAMRVDGAAHATYVGGWWRVLQLRIDHAFVTRDWCAAAPTIFPVPGSDHLGLQVSIGRCRS